MHTKSLTTASVLVSPSSFSITQDPLVPYLNSSSSLRMGTQLIKLNITAYTLNFPRPKQLAQRVAIYRKFVLFPPSIIRSRKICATPAHSPCLQLPTNAVAAPMQHILPILLSSTQAVQQDMILCIFTMLSFITNVKWCQASDTLFIFVLPVLHSFVHRLPSCARDPQLFRAQPQQSFYPLQVRGLSDTSACARSFLYRNADPTFKSDISFQTGRTSVLVCI